MVGIQIPKTKYSGRIKEVTIGTGNSAITVGGQNCLNFYVFEGEMPNKPVISMEITDCFPEEWPDICKKPFEDVLDDPVSWAKKCVEEFGAELLTIYLTGIDPSGLNRPVSDSIKVVENIVKQIDVPLIIWGCDNIEKDAEALRLAAEACQGKNVALGPVVDKNYKQIAPAAIAGKHIVVASTPIDVNLAKQLNILLIEFGVPENKILMDPTTGGLGYGIEYTYSVMERDRIAALIQNDDKLAFPMICHAGREIWKAKEATVSSSIMTEMGDENKRGIIMEVVTSTMLLLAGADIVVMRHPEAIRAVKKFIQDIKQ